MRDLFFAAHNDDEVLFGSWLLLRYRPLVIVCFRSVVQEAYRITASERERETDAAMKILGCEWRQWPLPDDDSVTDEQLEEFMWGLFDPMDPDGPDRVFAPAIERNGALQHNMVGVVAQRVFPNVVTHYLTYTNPPLTRSRSAHEIEYSADWLFTKHEALACYQSQARTPSYRHFVEDLREYLA